MPIKRHKAEQIVSKLRQIEVLTETQYFASLLPKIAETGIAGT